MDREKLLKGFIDNLDVAHSSSNTKESYVRYVNSYLDLLERLNKEVGESTIDDVTIYLAGLNRRNSTSTSSLIARTAIRRFLDINEIDLRWRLLKLPKKKTRESRLLNENEFLRLVDELPEPEKSLAILIAGSGLRISEALNLMQGDIDWDNNKLYIVSHGKKMDGLKTGEGVAKILSEAVSLLKKNNSPILKGKKGEFLFMRGDDKSVLVNGKRFWDQLQKAKSKAKVFKKIKPHLLRHSYGTVMYKKTRDIVKTKNKMRHSSINSTERYVHLLDNEETEKLPFEGSII